MRSANILIDLINGFVIDDYVYDVTKWAKRHPGGEKIISGYAGHDASVN